MTGAAAVRDVIGDWTAEIERTFRNDSAKHIRSNSDAIAAIQYFLDSIGWADDQRRFFEALPHVDPIETIAGLRQVLFRLGFSTTVEPVVSTNIRDEYLPCFIKTAQNEFLIARDAPREGIVNVYDPSANKLIEMESETLSGIAIFPERADAKISTTQVTVANWTRSAFQAFFPSIKKIFLLSFAINIFSLLLPLYVMTVYDKAIGAKSTEVLTGLTIGILLIAAADYGLRNVRVRLKSYLGARIDNQSSEAAFRKLVFFPLSMIEDAPIGSQLTRLRQMGAVRDAFTGALSSAVFDLPFVVLFLVAMAVIGGYLALIPLLLIILCTLMAVWAIPRSRRLLDKAGDAKRSLQNISMEIISARDAIRHLHCEEMWIERYRRLSAEAACNGLKMRKFNLFLQTTVQVLVTFSGAVILMLGALMIIENTLSVGALIALMAFTWRILNPIRSMFLASMTLGLTLQGLRQIDRLMAAKPERQFGNASSLSRQYSGDITFDRLSFRYPLRSEPTLFGVSFAIKKGELVSICGPSGAGKSTIQKLLLGLHTQQAGSILIDGSDLRQLDLGHWRQSVSVMAEFTDFFYGTISQNIRLAFPSATNGEIDDVVRRFGVDAYFGNILRDGLETRITEANISSWPDALLRRLAMCRTFVCRQPICILDNPAANLDAEGEKALLAELEKRRGTATTIMATHRPSHMQLSDKILVIKQGMVAAFGPPNEVFSKLRSG